MTDEELGELMRQCWNEYPGIHKFDPFKFGRLVYAAEREACERECENWVLAKYAADAIRARGNTCIKWEVEP